MVVAAATKFVNVLETSKLRIRRHYLDSVSSVTASFLNITICRNSGPWTHHVTQQELFVGLEGSQDL